MVGHAELHHHGLATPVPGSAMRQQFTCGSCGALWSRTNFPDATFAWRMEPPIT
jgi:hypothetical protein